MDHGERIACVEAKVEAHDQQLARIEHALERLQDSLERGLAELRQSIEELRREQAKTNRWLIGLVIGFGVTYGTAILGMMAKLAGIY